MSFTLLDYKLRKSDGSYVKHLVPLKYAYDEYKYVDGFCTSIHHYLGEEYLSEYFDSFDEALNFARDNGMKKFSILRFADYGSDPVPFGTVYKYNR